MSRSFVNFGRLRLGRRPVVAAVVTGGIEYGLLERAVEEGADLFEIRVDTFKVREPATLKAGLKGVRALGLPLLLTIRSASEGGANRVDDRERLFLYRELTGLADAVDVELGSAIVKDVVAVATAKRKKKVLSYHNFETTPDYRRLRTLVGRARRLGADVVKIATKVRHTEELKRLASILLDHDNLIVIGMGSRGKPSRVLFPYLGSLITYASLSHSTAPGQPTVGELKRFFSAL